MLLWFVGLGVLAVWAVFRDEAMDFRVVVLGVLLPLQSVVVVVIVLVAVMALTRRRRAGRRRWLGLPIGMFVHLVLDAAWTTPGSFWWPALGWDRAGAFPGTERGLGVLAVQEVVGLLAILVAGRRFGFADRTRRAAFVASGRLSELGAGGRRPSRSSR